ncbi:MAG: zf-HC2 domain-containing protein [Candidatus Promineifilaceae bacterium]|nr:zf-HC2 domain-containing protein [Candidatus Promineifilaceae bacterium]
MLDFLRNWRKSSPERRQEQLNAYLDGELSQAERERFEEALADDAALQREVAQLQLIKQQVRQLPRLRAPRNFTLDPAKYGRPARQPLLQLYPVLRTATVMTAIMLVVTLAAGIVLPGGLTGSAGQEPAAEEIVSQVIEEEAAADVIQEEAAEEPAEAYLAPEAAQVERATITQEADASEQAAEEMVAAEEEVADADETVATQTAPAEGEAAPLPPTAAVTDAEAAESAVLGAAATPEAVVSPVITLEPDLEASVSQPPETVPVTPDETAGADDAAVQGAPAGPTALTVIQIVLASLLVLLLAATLWLRRRV